MADTTATPRTVGTPEFGEDATFSTDGAVVVGIDDSPEGREALSCAARIAKDYGWRLCVVHAWQMVYPVAPFVLEPPELEPTARQAAIDSARDVVQEVLGNHDGVDVTELVTEGPAAAVLVEASKDARLLVVGSRGRGGFASLTLGSVSSACVHHAHCPVLVIRPRDHGARAHRRAGA